MYGNLCFCSVQGHFCVIWCTCNLLKLLSIDQSSRQEVGPFEEDGYGGKASWTVFLFSPKKRIGLMIIVYPKKTCSIQNKFDVIFEI